MLAVANTMDLPERTLSNKISSRLGMCNTCHSATDPPILSLPRCRSLHFVLHFSIQHVNLVEAQTHLNRYHM